ncbi:MAG: hypothetical protein R3F13_01890 [Prosthecobacter sp.]
MKLKHRITGTILMIAFATTTALPAATIPSFKAPAVKVPATPKVISAPKVPVVPKVPVTPKVPVVPKVVSAPKVPVVKVPVTPKVPTVKVPVVKVPTVKVPSVKIPNVKVPTTPKTPTVVKVPAVKVPSVKVPATPKTPTVAKAPVRVPTTPKTTLVSNKAATSKVSPKIVSTNTTVASSGIRQAVRDAKNSNPKNVPDAGGSTKIPTLPDRGVKVGASPSSGSTPGTGSSNPSQELFDVLRGKGGSTSGGLFSDVLPERNVPVLQDVSQEGRAFDQGFGSATPDLSGFDKGAFNPMNGITSGGSIGGPLGEAADQADGGRSGTADLGSSLISDGGAASTGSGATTDANGEVKARGNSKGFFDYLKEKFGIGEKEANAGVKRAVGIGENRNGYEFLNDPDGDPTPAPSPAPAPEPAPANDQTVKGSSDGRTVVVTDADGTKHVYVDSKKVGTIAPDGTVTPTESAGQPDPENEGAVDVDIYAISPGIARQVGQSRSGKKGSQGGNGDMTPTDDSNGTARNGSIAANVGTQIKNSLVGNPGQNGGMREGGGTANAAGGGTANAAPVRSNGSGVITPTNDQNMSSSGGRQEDAGDFFGNGIGPDQSRLNGSSSSSSSNDSSSNSNASNSSSKKEKKSK